MVGGARRAICTKVLQSKFAVPRWGNCLVFQTTSTPHCKLCWESIQLSLVTATTGFDEGKKSKLCIPYPCGIRVSVWHMKEEGWMGRSAGAVLFTPRAKMCAPPSCHMKEKEE